MKIKNISNFFFHTLRGRLILSVALVHAVMMSVLIIDLTRRQRAMILNRQTEEAIALSRTLSTSAAGWISSDDIAGLQELVDNQRHYPELIFAILTDENGRVLAHTDRSKKGLFLQDISKKVQMSVISKTPDMVDVIVPAMLKGTHVGWVRVGIGQKVAGEKLSAIILNGIFYTFLAILTGSIIAWIMGNRITKRLYLVQDTIGKVSKGNPLARTQITGKDEAALLAHEFNTMLDTLSDRDTKIVKGKERFENLFNLAALPLALYSKDGKGLNNNKSFEKTFGYTLKDVPTIKEWWKLAYPEPEYRKGVIEEWEKDVHLAIIENTNITPKEYKITCKNNDVRIVVISGTIIENEILVTFFDITERKKVEEELCIEKLRAEESDKLKSAFLANMSHEIRTPMNGILGFAELLKTPELTGEKQQKYIGIIEKSGARMLNIINNIIDISKIESGLMEVQISEININEQIEYIYTFFNPEVEGKGMQLFFKKSLSLEEAIIKSDREKIYAILTNLIKNAIKYTNEGSIEFGYEKIDEYLNFYVKDTGIGIPTDRKEAIFQRFIQADILDRKAFEGAGLGLAIAKSYVEMLGGKIWVETEEGQGSIFYFTVPYNTEINQIKNIKNNEMGEDKNFQIENLKVLIAEDDEPSDLLITFALEKFSSTILHAKNGIEAIEICRKNPDLNLIMMDLKMPEMSGYEATRQIRKFNENIIIIAQTAFGLSGDKEKAIEAGCNDFISKPIKIDELLTIIRKYFEKEVNY